MVAMTSPAGAGPAVTMGSGLTVSIMMASQDLDWEEKLPPVCRNDQARRSALTAAGPQRPALSGNSNPRPGFLRTIKLKPFSDP
jgi:hypothetical protein